ncbi:hypothetical protein Ddc_17567 [Ditylenchus destructor]|nr:hypothetical protein Ddc_17567 [Ditylenchus destructor]
MLAVVSIALLLNANGELSYSSESSYSSDSTFTSSSGSDDVSDPDGSGLPAGDEMEEADDATNRLTPFQSIFRHLPFTNVMVPYDVGKRHKVDTSDPYMGYAPTSRSGKRHYVRVSDSFDCDKNIAIFDFVMCYMANFGFSHGLGGIGATPSEVAKKFGKRWIVGLEVINKLIVHHTRCDLIEHMSNPKNATNNRMCSVSEADSESGGDYSSSRTRRYKRRHLKHLKHRKGSHTGKGHVKTLVNFKGGPDSHIKQLFVEQSRQKSTILVQLEGSSNYHIKIVTYGMGSLRPLRLYWSQIGESERWLRLHCSCGGWTDIVENCDHRSVHSGGDPAQDVTEDVREHLPQCEKHSEAFKCDSYKVKFTQDCKQEIAKVVEYEQENGIIPRVDDEQPEDEPLEESTTTTTTRALPVPQKPVSQIVIGDTLMPFMGRKKPN